MLNQMPVLESCSVSEDFSPFDGITGRENNAIIGAEARKRLGPLSTLSVLVIDVDCSRNIFFVDRLLDHAPNLNKLHWSTASRTAPLDRDALKRIVKHRSLRQVKFLQLQHDGYVTQRDFDKLHMSQNLSEMQMGHHDKVQRMRIDVGGDAAYCVGTIDTEFVDGLISPALVRMISSYPSLASLNIRPAAYAPGPSIPGMEHGVLVDQAIQFRVYESHAGDKLVLAHFDLRLPMGSSTIILRPHYTAYATHDNELENLRERPKVCDGGYLDVKPVPLSNYHDWPLPRCLVNWIEDTAGTADSWWTTGARGLTLPDEIWAVLQAWWAELESRDTTQIGRMDMNDWESGDVEDDEALLLDGSIFVSEPFGDDHLADYDAYDQYDGWLDSGEEDGSHVGFF
jgi:hypothetical protein